MGKALVGALPVSDEPTKSAVEPEKVGALVDASAVQATPESLRFVYEQIGGHPLLWQQILRRARGNGCPLGSLTPETLDAIIASYVHRKCRWLAACGLGNECRNLIDSGASPTDGLLRARLMRSGLFQPGPSDLPLLDRSQPLELLTPAIHKQMERCVRGASL